MKELLTTWDDTDVLNLDPEFNPLRYGVFTHPLEFKSSTFPGGEPLFQITSERANPDLVITQRYNTVADLVLIILATDAARRMGYERIQLILPYFPAARQDRVCNPGESLTVKVFADMINQCNFDCVFIYSPHSEVTPAVLDNVKLLDLDRRFLERIIDDNKYGFGPGINIVCPDAGAGKRVSKLATFVANAYAKLEVNLIRCEKVRDVRTGELKEFIVQADDLGGLPSIICDDIVAYGGTFKGLGEVLKAKGAGELILFTSHNDCDAGLIAMSEYFHQVWSSNSKSNRTALVEAHSNLHIQHIEL